MRRKRFLRLGSLALALCTVLVCGAQPSNADDWYPGLPDTDGSTSDAWLNAAQGGLSYATRAKQWFRTPDGMVTISSAIVDHGRVGDVSRFGAFGIAYIVSPKGAPANYGYLAPVTVRSAGFGMMPVEATVQISQRRENGYPIPLSTALSGANHFGPNPDRPDRQVIVEQVANETTVKDAFNVQILGVKIDGVDLRLTGDCRTARPAPVRMSSPRYTIPFPERPNAVRDWYASHDPSEFFHPNWGGQLSGTITIPPFTGCTTAAGDDLSDLMTLSVSGAGNPVTARVGWPCEIPREGTFWPAAPGQSTPISTINDGRPIGKLEISGCNGTKKLSYPGRE